MERFESLERLEHLNNSLRSFQHHGQLLTCQHSMPNLVALTASVCKTDREEKNRASISPSICACLFILMSMYVKWYSGMYTRIHGPTHPDPQRRSHTLPSIMGRRLGRETETGREINRERDMGVEAVAGFLPVSWLIWTIFCLMSHFIPQHSLALLSSRTIKRSRQRLLTTF